MRRQIVVNCRKRRRRCACKLWRRKRFAACNTQAALCDGDHRAVTQRGAVGTGFLCSKWCELITTTHDVHMVPCTSIVHRKGFQTASIAPRRSRAIANMMNTHRCVQHALPGQHARLVPTPHLRVRVLPHHLHLLLPVQLQQLRSRPQAACSLSAARQRSPPEASALRRSTLNLSVLFHHPKQLRLSLPAHLTHVAGASACSFTTTANIQEVRGALHLVRKSCIAC